MKIATPYGIIDSMLLRKQEDEWNGIPDPGLDRFFGQWKKRTADTARLRTDSRRSETFRQGGRP